MTDQTPLIDLKRDELEAKAIALNYPKTVVEGCQNKDAVIALINKGEYASEPPKEDESTPEATEATEVPEATATIAEEASTPSPEVADKKPKTKNPKEPKVAESVEDIETEVKLPAGQFQMLTTVKHDDIIYENGKIYKLGKETSVIFKSKGFIK